MKKFLIGIFGLVVVLLILFYSFFKTENTTYVRLEELEGKTIGVQQGTIYFDIVKEIIPNVNVIQFKDYDELTDALLSNKIDGYAVDEPSIKEIMKTKTNLTYIKKKMSIDNFAYAFNKNQKGYELQQQFNEFLLKIQKDGTYNQIQKNWFEKVDYLLDVDYTELPNINGKIILGAEVNNKPFCFLSDNKIEGYEIDLVISFCKEYGYALDIKTLTFEELMQPSEKLDIRCSSISITDERKEIYYFSNPTYESGGVIAVINYDTDNKKQKQETLKKIKDLEYKNIGVIGGSIYEDIATLYIEGAKYIYYDDYDEMLKDLENGMIDGVVIDDILAKQKINNYNNLNIINQLLTYDKYGFGFNKNNKKQLNEFNEFLKIINIDGRIIDLENKWVNQEDSNNIEWVDYDSLPNVNGKLTLVTPNSANEPFTYVKKDIETNKLYFTGYDIELAYLFCKEYGYALEIVGDGFENIFPGTSTIYDMCCGCITIKEERKIIFSI